MSLVFDLYRNHPCIFFVLLWALCIEIEHDSNFISVLNLYCLMTQIIASRGEECASFIRTSIQRLGVISDVMFVHEVAQFVQTFLLFHTWLLPFVN